MIYIRAALAAAALLAPAAAMAHAPKAREHVSLAVSTAGLDLTRPEGVEALQSRMNKAIAEVCNPGDRLDADLSPDFQCRREMAADVRPVMLEMAARAAGRHLSAS